MKNVVLNDIGRENEFRPDTIFKKYLKMIERDAKKEFGTDRSLFSVPCPACHSRKKAKVFRKFGFQYAECQLCSTLYMSPRPNDDEIKKHYLKSPSMRFWKDMISKTTENKRKEKIYGPRVEWMIEVTEEYFPSAKKIGDFNSKDIHYVAELLKEKYFKEKILINPYFDIKELPGCGKQDNFIFIPDPADLKNRNTIDVASAFEVLDLTSDVDYLMKCVSNALVDNGLFFMTTVSISGFDLQVLWENSQSIFPPDRINAFSQDGLKSLFKRHGFEMLEYSTPGLLDLDIVRNALKRNPGLAVPRFIRTIVESGNDQLFQDFQKFLQINKLSSFVRIVLRKNER